MRIHHDRSVARVRVDIWVAQHELEDHTVTATIIHHLVLKAVVKRQHPSFRPRFALVCNTHAGTVVGDNHAEVQLYLAVGHAVVRLNPSACVKKLNENRRKQLIKLITFLEFWFLYRGLRQNGTDTCMAELPLQAARTMDKGEPSPISIAEILL